MTGENETRIKLLSANYDHNEDAALLLESALNCIRLSQGFAFGTLQVAGEAPGEPQWPGSLPSPYAERAMEMRLGGYSSDLSRALAYQAIADSWRLYRALRFKGQDWLLLPEQRKVIIKKLESLKNVRDFLEHGRDTKTGTSAKPEVHNHNGCLIGDGAFLITADKVLMGGLELGEFQKELEVFEEWIGFMALHHKREFINRGLDWREVRLERSRGYLRFPYEDWE